MLGTTGLYRWVVERPNSRLGRNVHSLYRGCCWEQTISTKVRTISPDLSRCSDDLSGLTLMPERNQKCKVRL